MYNELNELLQAAKEVNINNGGTEFKELPEGEYVALIHAIEFTTSKAGNFMLKWEFILTENENFNGQHHWKYNVLNSPENMKRTMTELEKFGVDTSDIDSITKDFEKMLDVPVKLTIKKSVSKKNGQEYTNTTVDAL